MRDIVDALTCLITTAVPVWSDNSYCKSCHWSLLTVHLRI